MLKVEPAGQRYRARCTATGSGWIGKEAVAGATSEVFALWLQRRTAVDGGISFRRAISRFISSHFDLISS